MIAIQKLIANAIDYAGLFPPASLAMPETVDNYLQYRNDAAHGMLGRLVVPAGRLQEIRQTLPDLNAVIGSDSTPWRISALVPVDAGTDYSDFHRSVNMIEEFNQQFSLAETIPMLVDSLELKVNSAAELQTLAGKVPANVDGYFEIDCMADPTPILAAMARLRQPTDPSIAIRNGDNPNPTGALFAKIRTGSVVAEQIPSVEQVSKFISVCARDFIPFKATAGLHHPIRKEYPLTYQPDAPCGTMHGFVNMFIATLFAYEYQLNEQEVAQILHEREPSNFHFEDDRIQWRQLTISVDRIDVLRRQSIQSFGSCSFTEPTQELCELYQCQFS